MERNQATREELFFREAFAHPLGQTSISLYLHHTEFLAAQFMLKLPISCWDAKILKHVKEEMKHTEIMHEVAAGFRNQVQPSQTLQMNRIASVVFEASETYMRTLFKLSFRTALRIPGIKGDQIRLALYYLLALLLERRIMKTYPYLIHMAPDARLVEMAKKIVSDERNHLKEVTAGVETHVTAYGLELPPMYTKEESIFKTFTDKFLEALRADEQSLIGIM